MGKFFHKISLSRFGRTLATLSNSGVPILDALDMTAKTSGNKVIEKAINDGGDLFIEVGPGSVLSNMIEDIDSSIPNLNVEDVGSLEKTVRKLT